jgi:hypothetical protein
MLTHKSVEHVKPRSARYELPDGGGLYLVVQASGARISGIGQLARHCLPACVPLAGHTPGGRLEKSALQTAERSPSASFLNVLKNNILAFRSGKELANDPHPESQRYQ